MVEVFFPPWFFEIRLFEIRLFGIGLLGVGLLSSCAGTSPKGEYVLSSVALENAQNSQASRWASDLMSKAREYYKIAVRFFEERNYTQAKKYFDLSRRYSEKAEVRSRIKKYKRGELL